MFLLKHLVLSEEDADRVLASLQKIIEGRMYASVEDYYNLCGVESHYQDSRYGWVELINVKIAITPAGLELDLPRPQLLSDLLSKDL